ncbi:MAG TPA: excinuclease ABC subunit UvrC [Candidatus Saccharimonadales bacterium]|nr:excinuclease ABC subunit UvrC [Candidatus Saccharimonadales bacterium]
MSTSKLHTIIANLPHQSGVYIFKDLDNQVLYVGKAKDLNKRVASYLRPMPDRPWATVMMSLAEGIETIVVNNEIEALFLETTLIKKHLPKFNILLTDDKSYPFIKLYEKEPIPRFTIVRRREKDGTTYFGPYLTARSARQTLELLRTVYGIHFSPKTLQPTERPCFNCQLLDTPCPINGGRTREDYLAGINAAIEVLNGKRARLGRDLKRQMEESASKNNFERAAKLRDQYFALRDVTSEQNAVSTDFETYDAVGLARYGTTAIVYVLVWKEGRIWGHWDTRFRLLGDESDQEIIEQFLSSVYAVSPNPARQVELPVMVDSVVEQYLTESANRKVTLHQPERGERKKIVELANKNAANKLELMLLKSNEAIIFLASLKELLHLKDLPRRIEAIDISNLGKSEAIGACVCFIDGVPDKNEYRKYKIKTVEGQNDFAMIREVVARRLLDSNRPLPDLLLIDGGPEQLKFAAEVLPDTLHDRELTLMSLAKKPDRIFLPKQSRPLPVKRGHKGLLFLARVRDEVHRFAIGFQRFRQSKKSLSAS